VPSTSSATTKYWLHIVCALFLWHKTSNPVTRKFTNIQRKGRLDVLLSQSLSENNLFYRPFGINVIPYSSENQPNPRLWWWKQYYYGWNKSYNYTILKGWPFSSFYSFLPKYARDASLIQTIFYANEVS